MQRLSHIGVDEVAPQGNHQQGAVEPSHNEEIGQVGEGTPIHQGLCERWRDGQESFEATSPKKARSTVSCAGKNAQGVSRGR